MIPYGRHHLDEEDIEAVVEILRNGPITQGEAVEQFGQRLAETTGASYGIAVANGTAALHLSVAALAIGPGDEVITTPMTFCATANVALYQGATVRFVDIDENTLNINPALIESQITERTKAIIPVDFRGHPADLPAIRKIADTYGLKVIEDGSHSLGSTYLHEGRAHSCGDGIHSDLCTFSFHPVKHITTGEGGAVLTNDAELYRRISLLLKHGIDRRDEMFNEDARAGSWIYDLEYLGFNYRMTDFQAALGISQLKKLHKFKSRRRNIVKFYNDRLSELNELILPHEQANVDSNFHIYTLQIRRGCKKDRYDFFEYLRNVGYAPMVHYIPVHLLKYYRTRYGHTRGDFPVAEKYYDQALSIPLYQSLTDAQVETVVDDIRKFFGSK
jgi:perosamine synthetase